MKYIVALAFLVTTHLVYADCSVSDIKITSIKAQFVKKCDADECLVMQGVATLKITVPKRSVYRSKLPVTMHQDCRFQPTRGGQQVFVIFRLAATPFR